MNKPQSPTNSDLKKFIRKKDEFEAEYIETGMNAQLAESRAIDDARTAVFGSGTGK